VWKEDDTSIKTAWWWKEDDTSIKTAWWWKEDDTSIKTDWNWEARDGTVPLPLRQATLWRMSGKESLPDREQTEPLPLRHATLSWGRGKSKGALMDIGERAKGALHLEKEEDTSIKTAWRKRGNGASAGSMRHSQDGWKGKEEATSIKTESVGWLLAD
jgi:hypothetical protein